MKSLNDLKVQIKKARATIKSQQNEVAVSDHRAKVEAQLATANGIINGIGRTGETFERAAKAVAALGDVIASGKDLGAKYPAYAKYLATTTKTKQALSVKIEMKRLDADSQARDAEARARTRSDPGNQIEAARTNRRSGGGPSGSLGSNTPACVSPACAASGVGMDSERVLIV